MCGVMLRKEVDDEVNAVHLAYRRSLGGAGGLRPPWSPHRGRGLATGRSQKRSQPTTTNMEPAGERLKFSVLRWSSEQDRREVLSILTRRGGERRDGERRRRERRRSTSSFRLRQPPPQALQELPSVGYLWPGGRGLGYSLKYAYRLTTPDGKSESPSSQGDLLVPSLGAVEGR